MEDRMLFIGMPLLVANIAMAIWGIGYRHLTGVPAYLPAILVALPGVAFIVIFGLYLSEEQDEFQRNLWVQSLLWGIGATLTVITFWGSLVEFELAKGADPPYEAVSESVPAGSEEVVRPAAPFVRLAVPTSDVPL